MTVIPSLQLGKTAGRAADGLATEAAFSQYKLLAADRTGTTASGSAAATYILAQGGPQVLGTASTAGAAFYFDPADYSGGAGRTANVRLSAMCIANAVAGVGTYTFSMVPVLTWGGASAAVSLIATVGASVCSATITAPAAQTGVQAMSTATAFPAAGFYAIQLVVGSAQTAGNETTVTARLMVQQV